MKNSKNTFSTIQEKVKSADKRTRAMILGDLNVSLGEVAFLFFSKLATAHWKQT